MTLDPDRVARYSRQLVIPAIGHVGQERLGAACVRVIGASGVAAPGILYLVLAGVGTLWIDDREPVGQADAGSWLYPPTSLGEPRASVAAGALAERSRFVQVLSSEPGEAPTATVILAVASAQAVTAAERARRAGHPHVVAQLDGEGGAVVTVPPGAPCFACARSVGGTWRPPTAAASAVAVLAAQEAILMLAAPSGATGRRVDVTRGVTSTRATARLAGCACGAAIVR